MYYFSSGFYYVHEIIDLFVRKESNKLMLSISLCSD